MKRELTDRKIKNLKPKPKPYKKADGGGLYVYVSKAGTRTFRFDCSLNGQRFTMTLGQYPETSLSEARRKHEQARLDLSEGIDPRERKKSKPFIGRPFSFYAHDTNQRLELSPETMKKRVMRMEKYLFPALDKIPVEQITTSNILEICQPVADSGRHESARLLATYCRQTFDTMLYMQLIQNNPAESVSRLLPTPKRDKNFAHVTDPKAFARILKGIETYGGDYAVKQALRLMPLVFLRPYNIRFMRWAYIDFKNRLIEIPAEDMKMGRPHKVPLSKQAIAILKDVQAVTGGNELVFQSTRGMNAGTPLSNATLNNAIARLKDPDTGQPIGKGVMSSHGFRHTASTLLNELGFNSDAIELQMAHLDKDRIRRTYNKAELLPERAKMMQAWADYIDTLIHGADVVPIRQRQAR
ncbi:MAG: integrase arm-type DNA-binding domain-containing protein [Hydrogenovibrio sp.]|uniref:tyrosine-type recombinase/integrase n=1 Tax=Hydrogenovibrio sp. TaxID=2065821 RepID=UPI0028708E8C|nr:integrase arm-type DNA-binding domain-containing protein [Hydrogenovibrio sp.]MDR9499744.1 integrase arm-type DNA-binding domain-containing protein [Hydrogenovibrio sp.]